MQHNLDIVVFCFYFNKKIGENIMMINAIIIFHLMTNSALPEKKND